MASFAAISERPLMVVVFPMTCVAGGWRRPLRHGHRVTVFAFHRLVSPEQEVFGIAVMIERRGLPGSFGVATRASGSKDSTVDIVPSMA